VKDTGKYWLIPASMHPPIEQGGTIMKTAADVESARRFAAFIGREHARAILRRYGFTVSAD
jgi:molybdate transport system substrate-binding protein